MQDSVERWRGMEWVRNSGVGEQEFPKGALYIVGLPIGNAADITLRALWVLALADCVAAEDTRQTQKILSRFGIETHEISVREFNEVTGAQSIIGRLAAGERVALVTDAGTPGVSDPGALVSRIVLDAGFRVIPVPGASAVVTALSAAGLSAGTFTFVGFVGPQAKARKEALARYAARGDAFVLYEAPHRIKALLRDLAAALGAGRRVVVAREVTKRFESFTTVRSEDLAAWAEAHEPRGEYAVLVDEAEKKSGELDEQTEAWMKAIAEELPASRTAAIVSRVTGVARDAAYERLMALKGRED
ncbi:MAG: 16S rRNA (cytidine(1402)-2'-O)-methyltransferase [Sutterellaceae bacterium]|nr:16S rRNA (cytidine(1402)-2'-O)-methyltransferase [Sutterellaceae bacterium]MDY2868875.1 16S rRNA (cytidine(1402)-2'-O)-methyltransferase [Mesosutterella sp.]